MDFPWIVINNGRSGMMYSIFFEPVQPYAAPAIEEVMEIPKLLQWAGRKFG